MTEIIKNEIENFNFELDKINKRCCLDFNIQSNDMNVGEFIDVIYEFVEYSKLQIDLTFQNDLTRLNIKMDLLRNVMNLLTNIDLELKSRFIVLIYNEISDEFVKMMEEKEQLISN